MTDVTAPAAPEATVMSLGNKCEKGTCFVFTSWDGAAPVYDEKTMRYMCYCREEAPTTGGLHWQGYVQTYGQLRFKAVQGMLKVAKGWCQAQKAKECGSARAYIYKQETAVALPMEFGTFHEYEQGKRTDIDKFVEAAKTESKRVMYKDHGSCMVKYRAAYADIRATFTEPRTWKTEVICVMGDSGSGKSHWCNEQAPEAFVLGANSKGWWCGYDAHEDVIVEDFKGWLKVEEMLQLMDKYKMTVNIKGGHAQFVARRIYISSVCQPRKWWDNDKDRVPAKKRMQELHRRIDRVVKIENRYATEQDVPEWWTQQASAMQDDGDSMIM